MMIGLAVLLAGVYWLTYSGQWLSNDEIFLFDAAESLARRGNVRLSLASNLWLPREYPLGEQPFTPPVDAEPLHVVAAAALFALADAIPGVGLLHTVWLLNVLVVAASGAVFFLYARLLGYRESVALAGALLYGLGTIVWPYSKVFFREPLALLLLFSAALCLHAWRLCARNRRGWSWLGGFALLYFLALLTKEAALLSIPIFLGIALPGLVVRPDWRRVGRALAVVAVLVVLMVAGLRLAVDLAEVPRSYDPFDRLQAVGENVGVVGYALLSYLFSPGRSLFAFSPVLLLGVLGVWLLMRRGRWREALVPVLAVASFVVGYAVFRNIHWFAGLAWGPRYLVPVTPFAMLAVLPVLEAVRSARAPAWSRWVMIGVAGLGVWAQLNGVLISQTAYFEELDRLGVVAWLGGTWDLRYSPLLLNPSLLGRAPLDLAWLQVPGAGPWMPLGAGGLVAAAGGGLWFWRRRAGVSRPGLLATALLALVGMATVFYVGLRSIYFDPRYMGDFTPLRDLVSMLDEHAQPDDILVLTNPAYQDYFFNYYRNRDVLAFTLPTAVGEQPSPEQPPGVQSNNPDMLLEPRYSVFLMNLPEYTDRVWLLNNSGPFTGYTVRPVEWFMARHYFPVLTLQTDEVTRLLLFSVNSDAPPDQAMRWPEHATDARFGQAVALLGYDLPPARVRAGPFQGPDPLRNAYQPGEVVPVSLLWRALRRPALDYNVGVYVVGPDGVVVAQRDTAPQATFRPMDSWSPGETIRDNHGLQLPADLAPGRYALWVKVYDWRTGEPLPVSGSSRTADGEAAILTTVEVR